MFSLKSVTSCLLVSFVISAYASSDPDPCLITRKCSTTEDIVYAVDAQQCYLFRNPCIYATNMCQRRERKEKDLEIVSKAVCKEKCRNYCTEEYAPVCAEYNNAVETFANKCEFHRVSCQNDKSYSFITNGACTQA